MKSAREVNIPDTVVRIYLDACCLSRLTDDQSQARVRKEAEAVEQLLVGVRRGNVELTSSEALEDEVRRNPWMERRVEAEALLSLATTKVEIDDQTALRAEELVRLGYGIFDAIHVAASELAHVDALLTVDDRLLRQIARKLGNPRIPVQNPVSWIKGQGL